MNQQRTSYTHAVLIVADYLLQDRAIFLPLALKKIISAYTKLRTSTSTMSHDINLHCRCGGQHNTVYIKIVIEPSDSTFAPIHGIHCH